MDPSLEVSINELTPVIEADRQTPRAITQSCQLLTGPASRSEFKSSAPTLKAGHGGAHLYSQCREGGREAHRAASVAYLWVSGSVKDYLKDPSRGEKINAL